MKKNDIITVVVPVYNVEKFLKRCVDSIINQTYKNLDIILVNDHSTDKSYEICKDFLKIDSRISLYQTEERGVSIARNIGIEKAKGDWISFVDSDDYLETNMLEKLYCVAEESNSDIIMCDAYVNIDSKQYQNEFYMKEKIFRGKEKEILQLQSIAFIKDAYNPQYIGCGVPWAKLYKKSFIINNNLKYLKNLPRRQDMIFNLEAFEKANEINYIQKKLYHYVKNSNSKVNRFEPRICYEYDNIISELSKFMNSYNKTEVFEEAYENIVHEYLVAYNVFFFHNKNTQTIDDKLHMYDESLNNENYYKILKKVGGKKLKLIYFLLKHKCKKILTIITFIKRRKYKKDEIKQDKKYN